MDTDAPRASMIVNLRALLRLSGFRRLMSVRLLSQFADGLFQAGLAAYVVFSPEEQTSSADIAAAMAVLLLPYSLLGPFAGVLLDRLRRRQVLLYGSLLRGGMAGATSALVLAGSPHWMFYLCALLVTAVNRFVLAALSAGLPRVVDAEQLLLANSLSPTAGTLAATTGAGTAFVAQFVAGSQGGRDATALLLAALVYVLAGLAALRMQRSLLGPPEGVSVPRLTTALADTARGLAAGLRHLGARPRAAWTLGTLGVTRFCYGALFVTLLMLARFSWTDGGQEDGLALLGLAVALSGAGFFVAALITPALAARLGALRWFSVCALLAAVLVPVLGLGFRVAPGLLAAFALGLVSQGTKIVTDTVLQSSVDDAFRGRVFSLYDMLYNIAFVAAAGLAALVLPPDGRSATLVLTVALLYAVSALIAYRLRREAVSRETATFSPERPTTP